MAALRRLTSLPFEVHLTANDPLRFVPALAQAGANLVFLPAETAPLLYEAIYVLGEHKLQAGLCLALGTPLEVLTSVLPMLDAVLLLGRVTGEGNRGRDFNDLVLDRVSAVRQTIDSQRQRRRPAPGRSAGGRGPGAGELRRGLPPGGHLLPLGSALHREPEPEPYLRRLRALLDELPGAG